MLPEIIFSFFAKLTALLVFAAFILAHNCALVWGAESLRLGFSGATATQLAGSIAVEQKLFDLYGVNVEFTQSAGTTMIRALDSGSLQVAIVGGGQALSAYLKGVEVRIISGLVNIVPFQLWVKPEISQLRDLKGKLIANTLPGTSLNLGTSILLQRAGLDPLRDVKLVAFGRLGLVSQALFTGVVDAALLSSPDTIEARRSGLRMLMDLATAHIPCPFTSVVTTKAVLEKSPGVTGSISQRNTSRNQTCADQSGYGKEDPEPKHAAQRPGSGRRSLSASDLSVRACADGAEGSDRDRAEAFNCSRQPQPVRRVRHDHTRPNR